MRKLQEFLASSGIPCAAHPESYLSEEAYSTHAEALAVALPENTAQVSEIIKFAAKYQIAIVPQGGNSNRTRAAIPEPDRDSIVINMCNMHTLAVHANTMTVDAGCTLAEVQTAAADTHQIFGIDLGARDWCQIGGNIATNAGGMQCIRYGNMREQVLGLEVVTPDGTVLNMMNTLQKNNTGYDLKQLYIGSEGTLGIITRAVLKLHPKPQHLYTVALACDDLDKALIFLQNTQEKWGMSVHRLEYLSPACQDKVAKTTGCPALPFSPYPKALLLLELADISTQDDAFPVAVEPLLASSLHDWLHEQMTRGIIADAIPAQSQAQAMQWWDIRERCGGINAKIGKQVKHDIAVPPEQLPNFIRAAESALAKHFPDRLPLPFGHWGDGNLHYNVAARSPEEDITPQAEDINRLIEDIAVAHHGTFSAEHGIGITKKPALIRLKDPAALALMHRIKACLDPQNMMNPNKVL